MMYFMTLRSCYIASSLLYLQKVNVWAYTFDIIRHLLTQFLGSDLGEPGLTYLVVSDDMDPAHLPGMPFRIHVVKQQWFGESIQIDACADEQLYQAKVRGGRGREGEESLRIQWRH